MDARLFAKFVHGYKGVVLRRTGERYFDHVSGTNLLLLLELGITDPDILMAAECHDILEDGKITKRELENALRLKSPETLRIIQMVTNPEKTGNEKKDKEIKTLHYEMISHDRKASLVKVADRIYNLRSLEVFHLNESELTEKHLNKAKKQLDETREYILPIAQKQ